MNCNCNTYAFIYVFILREVNPQRAPLKGGTPYGARGTSLKERIFYIDSSTIDSLYNKISFVCLNICWKIHHDKDFDIFIIDSVPKSLMNTYLKLYYEIFLSENYELLNSNIYEIIPENKYLCKKDKHFANYAFNEFELFIAARATHIKHQKKIKEDITNIDNNKKYSYTFVNNNLESLINILKNVYINNLKLNEELDIVKKTLPEQFNNIQSQNKKLIKENDILNRNLEFAKQQNTLLKSFNEFLKNPSDFTMKQTRSP
mgnify:CR=1 FL=1